MSQIEIPIGKTNNELKRIQHTFEVPIDDSLEIHNPFLIHTNFQLYKYARRKQKIIPKKTKETILFFYVSIIHFIATFAPWMIK